VGLAAVRSSLQQVWAGKITFDRDFEFEIVDKFGGRFVNGTKLGRVRVIGDPPIGPNPWMYMQAYLSVEIAFGKGSPAYGGRVIETLRALHETTSLVIRQFKAEFP
jgi:hypothetical protein